MFTDAIQKLILYQTHVKGFITFDELFLVDKLFAWKLRWVYFVSDELLFVNTLFAESYAELKSFRERMFLNW